ncbi:MAG: hypothetical protein LBE80_08540 [Deltaproteobacteria bacterium]|jgi:hypothetical protein|nr:hypothetical protein [Deltaproteobacteria bacterium]
MPFCPNCGTPFDSAKFCHNCGQALESLQIVLASGQSNNPVSSPIQTVPVQPQGFYPGSIPVQPQGSYPGSVPVQPQGFYPGPVPNQPQGFYQGPVPNQPQEPSLDQVPSSVPVKPKKISLEKFPRPVPDQPQDPGLAQVPGPVQVQPQGPFPGPISVQSQGPFQGPVFVQPQGPSLGQVPGSVPDKPKSPRTGTSIGFRFCILLIIIFIPAVLHFYFNTDEDPSPPPRQDTDAALTSFLESNKSQESLNNKVSTSYSKYNESQRSELYSLVIFSINSVIDAQNLYYSAYNHFSNSYEDLSNFSLAKINNINYGPLITFNNGKEFSFSISYNESGFPLFIFDSSNIKNDYLTVEEGKALTSSFW